MAQVIVRNLEDDVKTRLQRRARRHGRSMEEEVRAILRNAVREERGGPRRLGSRIAARFAEHGLDEAVADVRGPAKPATFDE